MDGKMATKDYEKQQKKLLKEREKIEKAQKKAEKKAQKRAGKNPGGMKNPSAGAGGPVEESDGYLITSPNPWLDPKYDIHGK